MSSAANRLADEALRMSEHPGIVFRPGPTGRRAGLVADPDVWKVIRQSSRPVHTSRISLKVTCRRWWPRTPASRWRLAKTSGSRSSNVVRGASTWCSYNVGAWLQGEGQRHRPEKRPRGALPDRLHTSQIGDGLTACQLALVEAAGLPKIRSQDARHSYATAGCDAKIDWKLQIASQNGDISSTTLSQTFTIDAATGRSARTLSDVTSGLVNDGYSDLFLVRRMRSNGLSTWPMGGSS